MKSEGNLIVEKIMEPVTTLGDSKHTHIVGYDYNSMSQEPLVQQAKYIWNL